MIRQLMCVLLLMVGGVAHVQANQGCPYPSAIKYVDGYFQATAVLFLPIYLVGDKGVAPEDTILVTALFALGMLLFANPAGLSRTHERALTLGLVGSAFWLDHDGAHTPADALSGDPPTFLLFVSALIVVLFISTRRTRGLSAPDLHSISACPLPVFAKMIAMLSPREGRTAPGPMPHHRCEPTGTNLPAGRPGCKHSVTARQPVVPVLGWARPDMILKTADDRLPQSRKPYEHLR